MTRAAGLVTFAALALAACATSGTAMQAECETRFDAFPDIYRCTKGAVVARNPGILQDARGKLYLLRGEQLARDVEEGRIASLDAKVSWQQLFVELKSANDKEILAAIAAMPRPVVAAPAALPSSPSPLTTSSQINCTSNKAGSTLYTHCE